MLGLRRFQKRQEYNRPRVLNPDTAKIGRAAIGTAAEPRARVWAGALRQRWRGKHARIRVRDDIPLVELRDKVCQKIDRRTHPSLIAATKSGPD